MIRKFKNRFLSHVVFYPFFICWRTGEQIGSLANNLGLSQNRFLCFMFHVRVGMAAVSYTTYIGWYDRSDEQSSSS
jgi:hypothetical protein